ncbi:MAG: L-aspartate oxidase [Ignavibacteriales bacterium]|nr:L-aspartate oxidase [Ignavibacteriales bacterium]
MRDRKTDVLVVGSGVAGLFAAIKIAEFANVALVTKKTRTESSTKYAQGGVASVTHPDDTFERHIADTLDAGAGLCHRDAVEALVTEGPRRIEELLEMGAEFTTKSGRLHLMKEGGHSAKRIVHAEDVTGKEIERALVKRAANHDNIEIIENALAIDLVTEHNIKNLKHLPLNNRHCWGAYVLDTASDSVFKIESKATILAAGGLGQIYQHTTNPDVSTGDGFAMAYRAGAKTANMEFVQFHPTSLYKSSEAFDQPNAFLVTEATRGYGAILRAKDGERFMPKYDERAELAPRDVVARAIDAELKRRGDDYALLDLTHKNADETREKFPNIYERCLEYGVDATAEPIPVVPAAHYACGGVMVDLKSRSSLDGLYACGENAMTGVHGANRLASNSLLEALVFSHFAAEDLRERLKEDFAKPPAIPDWDETGALNADEMALVSHDAQELKQLMWDLVGVVRSDLRLESAKRRVRNLYFEVEEFYKKTKVFPALIELRNLITCAHLIIKCATARKESRGLHYTIDYPDKWPRPIDTIIQNTYQKS